jgi:hypothetical protein
MFPGKLLGTHRTWNTVNIAIFTINFTYVFGTHLFIELEATLPIGMGKFPSRVNGSLLLLSELGMVLITKAWSEEIGVI